MDRRATQRTMAAEAQQTLPFGLADGSARQRRIQLARAVRDLRLGSWESDAVLLALLVFDQSADGLGVWEVCDTVVLGHACGPSCKRSKFYSILGALTEPGILSVEKIKGGDGLRRRYGIRWASVYAVRGLPIPGGCRRGSDAVQDVDCVQDVDGKIHTMDFHTMDFHGVDFSRAQSRSIPARTCPGAPASARLSSCLVVLSSVDDNDIDNDQEKIRKEAERLKRAVFHHRPGHRCNTEERRFLASIAAIAVRGGGLWQEWVDNAASVCLRVDAKRPVGHFRGVLWRSLIDFAGVATSEGEAQAALGQLLVAARPLARPLFLRSHCRDPDPVEVNP